jgi:cell division septation protein DedD
MTLRALPRSRLDRLVPPLMRDGALIALVPVSDDTHWVAEAAWSVARAAAMGSQGRRRAVALVDLCFDAPFLHQIKKVDPVPGIADAFASDGALSDVAHDVDGVHFLPAGTPASDVAGILSATRWRRLQAGFRSEGALLLVCLPADRLPELGADPDGVVALSPGGVDLGTAPGRALLAARERGIELLGVVRERWSAPSPALLAAPKRRVGPRVLALAAVAAIVGTVLLSSSNGHASGPKTGSPHSSVSHESFGTAQAAASAESLPAPGPALPALASADSGGWTLQLAAYGAPERAQSHVDRLAAAGLAAFISPLAPDASGTVWYRVLAGAYGSRLAATAARRTLWKRGLAARGEGTPLLAPYSLVLAHSVDAGRLRTAGLAGIRWGTRNAVLVGAFEHPEQAAIAAAQLQRLGIATTLVTRTDRNP